MGDGSRCGRSDHEGATGLGRLRQGSTGQSGSDAEDLEPAVCPTAVVDRGGLGGADAETPKDVDIGERTPRGDSPG